jgi:integrase
MKLTKSTIDTLAYDPHKRTASGKPATQQIAWDDELRGFGLRLQPGGVRTFVVKFRTPGGQTRMMTLGRFGTLTPDQARKEARKKLTKVAEGIDPVEEERRKKEERRRKKEEDARRVTFAAFHEVYVENAKTRGNPGRKKRRPKKSWREDDLRIARHIIPAWGNRRLDEITQQDVRRLHASIKASYEANRVLALISVMYRTAEDLGILPAGHPNPARGVVLNAEDSRDRFVTEEEMPRALAAIQAVENEHLRGAFMLYLLTGLRRAELCRLQWSDVDMGARRLRLPTSKSGRPLLLPASRAAVAVLEELPKVLGNSFVLASPTKPKAAWHPDEVTKKWREVSRSAGLEDVRLHDLRRTVGSWLAMDGASLPLIGKVLNHSSSATTEIYARLQDEATRQVLEDHGDRIAAIVRKAGA